MKTIIDPEVLQSAFGEQILSFQQNLGVAMEARTQNINGAISWQRSLHQKLTERNGNVRGHIFVTNCRLNTFLFTVNSLH